jgi:hypothetical protein
VRGGLFSVDAYPPHGEDGGLEAEHVLVDVDGDAVVLTLDDGTELRGDRAELVDLLNPAQPASLARVKREAA